MPYRIKSPVTRNRIGFRGGVLLIYGILEIIVSWAIFSAPSIPNAPLTAFTYAPIAVYGLIWLIPGIIATVSAFFIGKIEVIGYAMSFIPFFLFGLGNAANGWPLHVITVESSLRGAAIFWAFALIIRIIVRWPEPEPPDDSHVVTLVEMIQKQNEIDRNGADQNGDADHDVHGNDDGAAAS